MHARRGVRRGVYVGGIVGGHYDHRHFDCLAVAGCAGGPRGGPAHILQQSTQAARSGPAQLRPGEQGVSARHHRLTGGGYCHELSYGTTAIWNGEAFGSARRRTARHELDSCASCRIMESSALAKAWNYAQNVGGTNGQQYPISTSLITATLHAAAHWHSGIVDCIAIGLASMDVKGCTARPGGIRLPQGVDDILLPNVATTWQGGGTDYGGCVGRHSAYTTDTKPYPRTLSVQPRLSQARPLATPITSSHPKAREHAFRKRVGHLRPDQSVHQFRLDQRRHFQHHHDRRVAADYRPESSGTMNSHDGWAVGGDATGFHHGRLQYGTTAG